MSAFPSFAPALSSGASTSFNVSGVTLGQASNKEGLDWLSSVASTYKPNTSASPFQTPQASLFSPSKIAIIAVALLALLLLAKRS